jgi:hypothetical protein
VQSENKSSNLKLIKAANHTYLGAVFCYAMYSLFTETGLCGYLMDLQFQWFGVAYQKMTALVAIMILGAPGGVVSSYIKRKEASIAGATNKAWPQGARSQSISWKVLLILSVAPTLIALPTYYVLIWMDQKDQQREIYKADLNRESELPPGDVKFVQLTGVVQLDYQYRVEEKSNTGSRASANTYIPLTGSGWTKEKPIRFFMNTTFTGYFDTQTKRSGSFSEQGVAAATVDGKLTQNGLPTYVEKEYQRAGLLIDSPYYVMDRMSFDNGRIPSKAQSQQYHLIPILGVGFSLALLVGGSIGLGIRKLRRAG